MKYTIVISMDTNKTVYEQISRNGFAVMKEGNSYTVHVPNQSLGRRNYNVKVLDDITIPETLHGV